MDLKTLILLLCSASIIYAGRCDFYKEQSLEDLQKANARSNIGDTRLQTAYSIKSLANLKWYEQCVADVEKKAKKDQAQHNLKK